MQWPPCEKDNEAVCNRRFSFMLWQITQKKQLQRAPKAIDSVDTYFVCFDYSKIFKLLNKLVGT